MIGLSEIRSLIALSVKEDMGSWQYNTFGISEPLGCKPINVNIEIINRCCLKCKMCDIWRNHDNNELDISDWIEVVDNLKDWLGAFRLTITGGEPFMKRDIWYLLDHCASINLPVVIVTNGFTLKTDHLERLLKTRLTQVVVSIDSLQAKIHDNIRGLKGSYTKTWRIIEFLASHPRPFLVATNTVIMKDNLLELGQIARKLAAIGVDRIFFQPIQGGFTSRNEDKWPFNSEMWPTSPEAIEEGIHALLDAKSQLVPIANTVQEIAHFKDYFLQAELWQRPWRCSVDYTTFHCDAYGNVRMCIPYAGNIGNVCTQTPEEIWKSLMAQEERQKIATCTKACLLNCNRSYSLQEKIGYGIRFLEKRL